MTPLYKFFALNLLFQDTSYSFALKYSSFLVKFFSFAFHNINFWFKISKICPKISHFSQISHSRGNTDDGVIFMNSQHLSFRFISLHHFVTLYQLIDDHWVDSGACKNNKKGSVYFTRIQLPCFHFQPTGINLQLPNHAFRTRGTRKRFLYFENQSWGTRYDSCNAILMVGELKARLW